MPKFTVQLPNSEPDKPESQPITLGSVASGVGSFFHDIFNIGSTDAGSFNAATPVGEAFNFVSSLPDSALKVGTDIFQAMTQAVGKGVLTGAQAVGAGLDAITGQNRLPNMTSLPIDNPVLKNLFGTDNLSSYATDIQSLFDKITTNTFAKKTGLADPKVAYPLAFAGSILPDAFNFYGGEGEESVIKTLVKETDPEVVGSTLRGLGISPQVADKFSAEIAKASDPAEVHTLLKMATGSEFLSSPEVTGMTEGTPEAPVKTEVNPQNYMDENVDATMMEHAQNDWEENFAQQYGDNAQKLSDVEDKLKEAKAAERPALEAQREELIQKGSEMEDAFTQKWKSAVNPETSPVHDTGAPVEKAPLPDNVPDLEKALNDTYAQAKDAAKPGDVLEKGGTFGEGPIADRALQQIKAELELSTAGYRYQTGEGVDLETHGVSSTFPDWVPEDLRSKKLFDKVFGGLEHGNLKMPPARNTRQVRLYNELMDYLDQLTGVDTSAIRAKLVEYGTTGRTDAKATETLGGRATGSEGAGTGRRVESSVGEGVQAAEQPESTAPQQIQDRVPLPEKITETPADTVKKDFNGPDKKSWQSLIKNYTLGLSEKVKADWLDYFSTPEFVLERLGLGKSAEMLHEAQDVYRATVKKEIEKIIDWKARANGPDSSRVIFQYLDGKELDVTKDMTPTEYTVAREIRAYLHDWADRLKLPEDNRISRYITHIFEPGQAAEAEGASMFDDPELAHIMGEKVAGSVYDPFLEKRLGKRGYKEDAWAALDAYVKRASRKEAMDPVLEQLKEDAKAVDVSAYEYVKKLSHRINMRPTEYDKLVDNFITSRLGISRFTDRPTAFITKKIRGGYYRGFLGLNFSSALRNLSQGANTYAKLGEKYTTIGYSKMLWKLTTHDFAELMDSGILDDAYVQDRKLGVYKTALQKMDSVLFKFFDTAEKINRGSAYYGAKSKALNEGLDPEQAVKYAKRMVRETQFAFSNVDMPVALSSDIMKVATQLQTYNVKQLEFFARMLEHKEYAGLVRWSASSLAFVYTVGRLFGMTPAQLIPTVQLTGSPFLSGLTSIPGAIGGNPQDKTKAEQALGNTLFWGRVPAGFQIKKTLQGFEAWKAGRDTTATGRTRYTIPKNNGTLVQTLLFGKNSLPQAQKYYATLNNNASGKGSGKTKFSVQ